VGKSHASSVIPVVRSSEFESLTVTRALVPLKDKAFPYFPEVVQVAVPIVPVFPLPDASVTIVPKPSLKPYAATRPGIGVGVGVGVDGGVGVGVGVGVAVGGVGVGVGVEVGGVGVGVGVAVGVDVAVAVAVGVDVGVGGGLPTGVFMSA
jgi:hypothetical protein